MLRKDRLRVVILTAFFALWLTWLVRARIRETDTIGFWWRRFAGRHGAVEAERLDTAFRQELNVLASGQSTPANAALRWHLRANILPGLALYRVLLREHTGNRRAALADVDTVFRVWTLARNRPRLALLKLVRLPFWLFRLALQSQMKSFPRAGWDFEFVEESKHRIAFNATRCFYLDTLRTLGAPELTASFCRTDDVMAELFPSSVLFVRDHTLGRGDSLCDFQYCDAVKP